jgi:hypothetical protein
MKIKANEVALPSTVKRGRIDLTEARKQAGLAGPMTEKEKSIIKGELEGAIKVITSKENLLKVQVLALKVTLGDIKKARQALSSAGKAQADDQVQPTTKDKSAGEAPIDEQASSTDDKASNNEASAGEQPASTADQSATPESHTGGEATS